MVMKRILALCAVLVVASCSDEKRITTGDGGGSGGGGSGGGGGGSGGAVDGGSGGTIAAGGSGGGGLPACANAGGAGDAVQVSLAGADGAPIAAPFSAAVTVTSVNAQGTTYTLTGPNQEQWKLGLYNSRMPAGFIKIGDMFDLTVDAGSDPALYATINQTVVLARAGEAIVFAASLNRFYRLLVPELDAFGIQVTDAGAFCQGSINASCIPRVHAAHVTVAGQSADVKEGETASVGGFSFTVAVFTELADTGACDAKSKTAMAGFRLP